LALARGGGKGGVVSLMWLSSARPDQLIRKAIQIKAFHQPRMDKEGFAANAGLQFDGAGLI
jgi:hypothetical protein